MTIMGDPEPESNGFQFGRNWKSFVDVVDESRIRAARNSLIELLGVDSFEGRRFLDVGCGSGLFSLAARRLGASVVSFDADPQSADCAMNLRRRFCAGDQFWTIHVGSVLDREHMMRLGKFDVVYAWGVLHHTGEMWRAIENTLASAARGGRVALALYNDQGWKSQGWRFIKRLYCSGTAGKLTISSVFIPAFVVGDFGADVLKLQNPARRYLDYKCGRGMSRTHDWHDWLGGYPCDVAASAEVIRFCDDRGFVLDKLIDYGGKLGNNQFVFSRR